MSILDFNAPAAANNEAGNQPFRGMTHPTNKPKSKLWLNVGYERGDKFVNLPLGLAIDTMDPAEIRGQNQDFINLRSAQNELLKHLQAHGMSMTPGEEITVNLTVKLRRVNEEMAPSAEAGELAINPEQLFGGPLVAAE